FCHVFLIPVTYTSLYTDSEPGRVFWGADEELSDRGSPRVVAPLPPDFVPEPVYPEFLVPSDAEAPMEEQPYATDASPIALSPGYVADSDPEEDLEEDSEEDHADYPADGGDDDDEPPGDDDDDDDDYDDDDDDADDEDEETSDDEEEEEHLASA
ncbi:hypothetical protein Tco_0283374, partial [Tanacetum coccineum]